ncbi:MAG TPA: GGDEF domain-containing protein [Acidimicrobiales bacterium]|nr:GGDEF domain-containing protein [Acidimicrobiales bacterium]
MNDDGSAAAAPDAHHRRTLVRKTATAVIVGADDALVEILGFEPDDLVGKTSLDFIHPEDQTLAVENWMEMLGSPGPARSLRLRHRHANGLFVWLELTNHNLLDDPAHNCVVADMRDLSDDLPPESDPAVGVDAVASLSSDAGRPMRVHEAIRARELLLHRLAEALPVGVLHVDASGRVLYTNQRLHTIVGRDRADTYGAQLSTVVAEDTVRVTEAFDAALHGGLDNDVEMRVGSSGDPGEKEQRQCTLAVRALVADDGEITGAVATVTDVTDSVRMREELRLRATFDKLTRCFNRASTVEALEKMLDDDSDGGRPAVIFVDLDRFKGINDDFGHAAGDELLEVVASRLQRAVREGDVVGRIGGDEFLVLCPGIATAAQAMRAATRVADSLRHAVKLDSGQVACRASVGVAWTADPAADADQLIGHADLAMYEAKRADSGHPVMYRPAA